MSLSQLRLMFSELTIDFNFPVRIMVDFTNSEMILSTSDIYLFRFLFFLFLFFGFVAGLEAFGGAINSFGTHCFA